jgi:molybdate transport system substrate-binding protein
VLGALTAVLVQLLAGCGSGGSEGSAAAGGGAATDASGLTGTITVSGATSLKAAFTQVGEDFTAANPGVELTFTFDASSSLATQILEGAPADVFASADEANMTKLTDEGLIAGEPEVFATNELVIVTKPGNPEGIETLADLAGAGVISLCGEEVPCGTYATEALEGAGVTLSESSVTRGQNAGATLTAVTQGDAVAGIVYVSDAESAGDAVEAVSIPSEANVVATYPIGALEASGSADAAKAFTAYVLSDEGQAVLQEYGFLPPT